MVGRFIFSFILITGLLSSPAGATPTTSLVITEVKASGEEFVEIANNGAQDVGTGWKLQYRSASGSSWSTKDTLSYDLAPNAIISLNVSGLAESGGHLRLTDGNLELIDHISWGSNLSSVIEAPSLPSIGDTQSLMRFYNISSSKFVDTDENAKNFFVGQIPTPGTNELHSDEEYPPIEISELLPDPDVSTLNDDEFIELYNPNASEVNLTGYSLHVGTSSYVLNGIALSSKQYVVLPKSYDPTDLTKIYTNLNLTATNGAVSVMTPNAKSLNKLTYSGGKKGLSYSVLSSGWKWTDQVTPGLRNLGPTPDFVASGGSTNMLTPCRSDQFRNPETNRCKLKETASSSLAPCASNQYRNPETNRCRLVSTASSSLQPCATDQFRNPETNRCKKIESANSNLKPCAPNQERNPETNRCRLVAVSNSSDDGTDAVMSAKDASKSLPLIGIIGGGALTYALYEWRYDIRNFFAKARGYLGFRGGSGRDP